MTEPGSVPQQNRNATAGAAGDCRELTARHGVHVGVLGKPHLHAGFETDSLTCCPTLMMQHESEIRGHSLASLYFVDYEPGLKTHSANLWALDDCIPEELAIINGEQRMVVFSGFLNPHAAIHLPVRPYFESCISAMNQVARWECQAFQMTIPADMPIKDASLAAVAHKSMGELDGWLAEATQTREVTIDISATGRRASDELLEVVAALSAWNASYFDIDKDSIQEGQQVQPLYRIDNVTGCGPGVSFRAVVKGWGPELVSSLAGQLAAHITQRDVEYRTLTFTMCPTNSESRTGYETVQLCDRMEDED